MSVTLLGGEALGRQRRTFVELFAAEASAEVIVTPDPTLLSRPGVKDDLEPDDALLDHESRLASPVVSEAI